MITETHLNQCKIFYGKLWREVLCMICSARTKPSNWKWNVAAGLMSMKYVKDHAKDLGFEKEVPNLWKVLMVEIYSRANRY